MVTFLGDGESASVFLIDGVAHKVFMQEKDYVHEIHILKQLETIESVVHMLGCDDDTRTIRFEYVPHQLEQLVRDGELDDEQKLSLLKQIVRFLAVIAEKKIVHNDFKAKNIMVTADKSLIKIIDFDLSKMNDDPWNDLKKFRLLVLQFAFDLDFPSVCDDEDELTSRFLSEFEDCRVLIVSKDIAEIDRFMSEYS